MVERAGVKGPAADAGTATRKRSNKPHRAHRFIRAQTKDRFRRRPTPMPGSGAGGTLLLRPLAGATQNPGHSNDTSTLPKPRRCLVGRAPPRLRLYDSPRPQDAPNVAALVATEIYTGRRRPRRAIGATIQKNRHERPIFRPAFGLSTEARIPGQSAVRDVPRDSSDRWLAWAEQALRLKGAW